MSLVERSKENLEAKKQLKIRWSWILLGGLLLLFGLSLPKLAAYYYSENVSETDKIIIPDSPKLQSNLKSPKFRETPKNIAQRQNSESKTLVKQSEISPNNSTLGLLAFQSQQTKGGDEKPNIFKRIVDWFVGLFKKKKPNVIQPAGVTSLTLSSKTIILSCPPGKKSRADSCNGNSSIQVKTLASNPKENDLIYNYTVSAGRVVGQGAIVNWDLSGVKSGKYTITAAVDNGEGFKGLTKTESVTIQECNSCQSECVCPALSITGPSGLTKPGDAMTFTANVRGGSQDNVTYNWVVSAGTIVSGQGTPEIVVATNSELQGQTITATVEIGGICSGCDKGTDSASAEVSDNVGTIRGVVKDKSGAGISGANVTLTNEEGTISRTTTSNANGEYEFKSIPYGRYKIKVIISSFGIKGEETVNVSGSVHEKDFIIGVGISNGNINVNVNTKGITNTNGNNNKSTNSSGNNSTNGNAANAKSNSKVNTNSNINVNANISNTSNSNTNQKSKVGSDVIDYNYPKYFLKDKEYKVNLRLRFTDEKVNPTTTETNVNNVITTNVTKPDIIISEKPGYEIFVDAELVSEKNLQNPIKTVGELTKYEKKLDQKPLHWQWKLEVNQDAEEGEKVKYILQLRVEYRRIRSDEQPLVDTIPIPLEGEIGLPLFIRLFSYLSIPGGTSLMLLGFIFRRSETLATETVIQDEVQCTLFAPPEAKIGNQFLVQVFAHLSEQTEALGEIAKMTDENLKKQAIENLNKLITRGSSLIFQLSIDDLEIDEPIQKYIWNGKIIKVPFIVKIPKDYKPGTKYGKVKVFEDDVPIGNLTFRIEIVDNIQTLKATEKELSQANFKRYQRAFISYASIDRPDVLERVQAFEAAKISCFLDMLRLNPGMRWEPELYKQIDQSDVVFLFWSKAASESEWVEKEILYAFARKNNNETAMPDIVPIILGEPPPAGPPPSLSFLHFNDKFIYLIYAAKAEQEIKARKPEN